MAEQPGAPGEWSGDGRKGGMSLLDRVVGVMTGAGTFILGSGLAVSVLASPDVTPSGGVIAVGLFLISTGLAANFVSDALEDTDDADEPSAEPDLDADVEETSNEVAA